MASEYFIQRQLDVLMEEPSNRNDWLWGKVEQDPVRRLEQLTRHHNGRIRQRAVLCLGLMHEVSALPSLIVRVNDWAVQVRAAARQSVRRFITPCHAAALVGRLPDFFHLLKGERDNHQRLVNEVIQFLIQTENRNVLFNGLNSHDRHVAKIVLQVLLEHQLFTPKVIYQQVKNHQSTAIRLSAAEAFIARSSWLSQDALMALLEQSSAPVKQITLQYIIDNQRSVPSRLMIPLLSDKSELVRKRAGRLLVADGFSPVEHYLTVFNHPSGSISERRIALLGLDEQKYQPVASLARECLACTYPAMYKTALLIVVRHLQEESRDYLLAALIHPSYAVARLASRQIVKLKLYLTLDDLQRCIALSPSVLHSRIYFSLAQRLGFWDCLIFMLNNAASENGRCSEEGLSQCNMSINHYHDSPSGSQQARLAGLLDGNGKRLLHDKDVLLQRAGEYVDVAGSWPE